MSVEICTSSEEKPLPRLGNCEVCSKVESKYTCPKCEVKTCSLECVNVHKKELQCDGIRDRTKFIPIRKMTENDFMSDYHFLEEATRFVELQKRNQIATRSQSNLPQKKHKLRSACSKRKIFIKFFKNKFSKSQENSSYFQQKTNKILWHLDWIFPNLENLRLSMKNCDEEEALGDLLSKLIDSEKRDRLEYYKSKGVGNLSIFLKAENVKNCKNRFYSLNCKKSLKENLVNKTIIEYPTVYVTYDNYGDYDVIDSDEEDVIRQETKKHLEEIDSIAKEHLNFITQLNFGEKAQTDKVKKQKEGNKKITNKFENSQSNLLFSNDSYVDALSSDEDNK
ncbi:ZNHIT6 family protein [Megaselia abdita]